MALLTPKQEKFCIEYMKCGNGRQAYINAGYKRGKDSTIDVNACNLLKNPKVKARLAELTEEAKNASIADIQEMQETLTRIIRQAFEEEIITNEGKVLKTASIKDVISAINTLGKMQGLFIDKVETDVDMNFNIKIDYGDEEQEA